MPGRPRVPTHDPPRVVLPSPLTPAHPLVAHPPWSPPPSPAGSTFLSPTPVQAPFHATPRRLDFTGTPSPRVESSPQMPSPSPLLNLPAVLSRRCCRGAAAIVVESPPSLWSCHRCRGAVAIVVEPPPSSWSRCHHRLPPCCTGVIFADTVAMSPTVVTRFRFVDRSR